MKFARFPLHLGALPNAGRRQWLRLLPAGLLAGAVCGRASTASVPDRVLPAQTLNQLVAQAFPYTRSISGLAELALLNPRLRLLPERNRLGTLLDVVLVEGLSGGRYGGSLDVDYGLRFDSGAGVVRMTDLQLNQMRVHRLPPQYQALLEQYAPPLARQLLQDYPLYEVPASQLKLARNLGIVIDTLRVAADGLHIVFAPAPL